MAIAYPLAGRPTDDHLISAINDLNSRVGGAAATDLDDLTDVVITAAASGEYLRHNGVNWVDATILDGDIPATITRDTELETHRTAAVHVQPQPPIIGATATTAVAGNDARLTDARTPTAHNHPFTDITGVATDAQIPATIMRDSELTKAAIDALNVDADTLDGVDSTGFATSAHNHALVGTATWDPASIANNTGLHTTMTVTGATVGRPVSMAFSSMTGQRCLITGYVSAADTVTAVLMNISGAAIDFASGTLTAMVHAT